MIEGWGYTPAHHRWAINQPASRLKWEMSVNSDGTYLLAYTSDATRARQVHAPDLYEAARFLVLALSLRSRSSGP
jgi:hypothetical protein